MRFVWLFLLGLTLQNAYCHPMDSHQDTQPSLKDRLTRLSKLGLQKKSSKRSIADQVEEMDADNNGHITDEECFRYILDGEYTREYEVRFKIPNDGFTYLLSLKQQFMSSSIGKILHSWATESGQRGL